MYMLNILHIHYLNVNYNVNTPNVFLIQLGSNNSPSLRATIQFALNFSSVSDYKFFTHP